MKLFVMTIRDRAIDAFGNPMYFAHIGQAVRGFSDAINSGKADDNMSKHPEDFDLYHLGSYDDSTATFELLDGGPRLVSIGKDVVKG